MKMKEDKKPDNVVFNTETQKYDAALKPYATNVGAPVITYHRHYCVED